MITQQANGNNSDSGRKEEFRNYLQRTNVIDVLTKVLVGLYEEPERPSNAIEYIRKYMGAPANVDVDSIKKENEDLKAQIEKLTTELEESKAKQHLVLKSWKGHDIWREIALDVCNQKKSGIWGDC